MRASAMPNAIPHKMPAEGIRINALVAGAFDTPMLSKAVEGAAGGDAERSKAMEQQFLSMVPLRRIGRPEEAAEAAAWLCSDASSYVTGHSMIVDGGWRAWAR
jgi:NAD(P)-dependent dehydrogenase (short-subunit alcohol dehydrogenase family)